MGHYDESVNPEPDDGLPEQPKLRDLLAERLPWAEPEDERLRELAEDVRRAWVIMSPDQRGAVRAQSGELYDALGALATFVSNERGAR